MGRARLRWRVCAGNAEDNRKVFIIVFGSNFFFLCLRLISFPCLHIHSKLNDTCAIKHSNPDKQAAASSSATWEMLIGNLMVQRHYWVVAH